MTAFAALDALAPGSPRGNAVREWAARIRAMAPGNPTMEAVAASLDRAAWRGEIRRALPWLAALATIGETCSTWSAGRVGVAVHITCDDRASATIDSVVRAFGRR